MSVGVISQIHNPTLSDIDALATAAEDAGADWLGIPDAFWWRDTWLLCAEAARATTVLEVGPLVTNPYLRHPFHTVAALATLQEIAGAPRVFLGLGAGGSEIALTAGVDRSDAPERIAKLVELIDRVTAGAPLTAESRRALEVPLARPPITIGARTGRVLRTAAAVADRVLLWAIPRSELAMSVALVDDAATARGHRPALIWAPLLADDDGAAAGASPEAAAYAILNSRERTRLGWGLDEHRTAEIRRRLVAGDRVGPLLPETAVREVIVPLAAHDEAVGLARGVGADGIAVPVADPAGVARRVAWAREVLADAAGVPSR